MDLIIVRHGEAGKRVPVTSKDAERTLTVSGRKEVEDVADSIERLNVELDLIATSPLKRSLETAQIIAKKLKKQKLLQEWDELKPEGTQGALYRRLSNLKPESSVMLVGHEPYLSTMISELISGKREARVSLKKAGVAKVEVTTLVPTPAGELRWLLTPRLMKKVS